MDQESASGSSNNHETFEFQAEIQKLLDILINRLYKNREIFLRELISNAADAADALHRARIAQLEDSKNIIDVDVDPSIQISFDEEENTITVSDNGYGMSLEEAKVNLGTIAQSGTLEFLQSIDNSSDVANLIGQFGVGFYSSFIVSNEVVVRSRSLSKDTQGVEWRSKGSGSFSVAIIEKKARGTDVILHLKDDAKEFANKFKLESIIKKYSDFVGFPIRIGDEKAPVNRQIPIWHQSSDVVKDEEYNDYYRQVSMDYTEPFHRLHLSVDAPIQFRALLFLPTRRNRMMMTSTHQDYGLRLYSKKILVQEKAKDLLPEYLRFVFGVVDSEDLPLNVSREVIQVDRSIRRISKVITGRILDELIKFADNEEAEEKYLEWWNQFGVFVKEGITQDEKRRKKLLNLLRINSSKAEEKMITLDKYIEQMPEDQEEIFYLLGENLQVLKRSPHLEHYKKRDQEVILFSEPIDSFVMMNVTEYKEKKFKPIDQAEPKPVPSADEKEEKSEDEEEKEEEKDEFLTKISEILGDKIIDVRYTDLLTDNPAGMGAFSRVLKYMEESYLPQKKIFEVNKEHPLIGRLNQILQEEPDSPLLELCTLQLFESQELAEGVLQDPTDMIKRINVLMKEALQ
ncbi:MAG: molecular chaperone HtpG [Candidatus Hodarchaeales archaeon]|jgi:molecular chaperone HtpG